MATVAVVSARYVLREGSRGGERILGQGDDPGPLLDRRDDQREVFPANRRVFDVIDTDATDPPESGVVERCPECGTPVLASRIDV